jgi:hypothetical protein
MEMQEDAVRKLKNFRQRIELAFRPDTALPRAVGHPHQYTPSSGHCAVVSAIVREAFGGDLVSATVQGESHWFNRLQVHGDAFDVDLTGDQFGFPKVRVAPRGSLHEGTKRRMPEELNVETLQRAVTLAERAQLTDIASSLRATLACRQSAPAR